jgi:hypothetical protein
VKYQPSCNAPIEPARPTTLVNRNAGAPNAANPSLYRSPVTSKPDGLRQSQQFDGLDLQDRR